MDDTLNKTKRGRYADAYYRSHHGIDSVIGHSLGGAVALSLEQQYKKEGSNPFGIVQSKTFRCSHCFREYKITIIENIVKDEIVTAGVAGGLAIGTSADAAIGFSDGGLLSGLGADIGEKISFDFANRITEDNNTSPNRIQYFGDPVSAFDVNATAVMPSFGFRFNNSAHCYKGLFIKDAAPLRDTMKNPLTISGKDEDAEVIAG